MHALELVAPQVGRELLELDGEATLARGLVTRQNDVGRPGHLAAVRLLPGRHEVELVELIIGRGPGCIQRGAYQIQPVPNLRVQDVALIIPEPKEKEEKPLERHPLALPLIRDVDSYRLSDFKRNFSIFHKSHVPLTTKTTTHTKKKDKCKVLKVPPVFPKPASDYRESKTRKHELNAERNL